MSLTAIPARSFSSQWFLQLTCFSVDVVVWFFFSGYFAATAFPLWILCRPCCSGGLQVQANQLQDVSQITTCIATSRLQVQANNLLQLGQAEKVASILKQRPQSWTPNASIHTAFSFPVYLQIGLCFILSDYLLLCHFILRKILCHIEHRICIS